MRRYLLAGAFGHAADDWRIAHDLRGKPFVRHPIARRHLAISAARSGNTEVFACAPADGLGVDIETQTHGDDRLEYVSLSFGDKERSAIETSADRKQAIIDLWLVKEAYGKGLGVGMNMPPGGHCFDLADHGCPRLRAAGTQRQTGQSSWRFNVRSIGNNLRLATAIRTPDNTRPSVVVKWLSTGDVLPVAPKPRMMPRPSFEMTHQKGLHRC